MLNTIKSNEIGLCIELKNLAILNLLVGTNGSGKSRLLSFVKNNSWADTVKVLLANPSANEEEYELTYTRARDLIITYDNNLIYLDYLLGVFFELPSIDWLSPITTKITREFENRTIEKLFFRKNQFRFLYDDGRTENVQISDGYAKMFNYVILLQKELNSLKHQRPQQINNLVFLIDEIENSFHPEYIKLWPKLIQSFIRKNKAINNNLDIQFIISTHSPFFVSSLVNLESITHKVYLLENGQTREIRNKNKVNTEVSNNGFSRNQALDCVNQMLGVNFDDITTQYYILSEESIHRLIISFSKKINSPINHFQYTTSGDAETVKRAISLHESFKALASSKCVIKTIFDGPLVNIETKDIEKLKEYLGENILYVKNDDNYPDLETSYDIKKVDEFLETKYPSQIWDRMKYRTFKNYLSYIGIAKAGEQGIIKSLLAEYIVENSSVEEIKTSLPFIDKIFDFKNNRFK